jgi:hypothetical protein
LKKDKARDEKRARKGGDAPLEAISSETTNDKTRPRTNAEVRAAAVPDKKRQLSGYDRYRLRYNLALV